MTFGEFYDTIYYITHKFTNRNIMNQSVCIHIGNYLYDIDHINTTIDMNSNKPNIVIHIKEN